MSDILHDRKSSCIIVAVISILLGITLIVYQNAAIELICRICGIVLSVLGASYIIGYFTRKTKASTFQLDMVIGVILLLIGLWMVFNPGSVVNLVQYVIGILILIHGIIDLQAALNIKSNGYDKWWVSLLLSIATIVLGILILFNPFAAAGALMVLIGIVLIFDGLSDLYIIFRVSKVFKAASRAAEEANAIETDGVIVDDNDE